MAVADSSEKRPEWCPPGRSRQTTRPVRPGSQSSSGSSTKRPSSSSFSRNSPSPKTPPSLAPPTKVRRTLSNQPSNPQCSRPRSSSLGSEDGAVSQTSSPDIHGKLKEQDLEPSQRTQSPPFLFSLPKELFHLHDSGQSYELGLSSGQDLLTLGSRLAEEIQMRRRVQDQLVELDAQLTMVSKHRNEAQSHANNLEQQLNSALEIQAAQQISNQVQVASILPDVRPIPGNPTEFTPENFIWVKQQWDRVEEENFKLDNSLHIASTQIHRLETEVIRLSRELENYQKLNIGHGMSMNDAAQQTKEEPPRMTTVATQTDFVDQNNTESNPIEPEHHAVPLQEPRIVMTDAAVQAVEQPDDHIMSDELPEQTSKGSGSLEVTVQEFRGERIDKEFEVCITQKASEASSSQTAASKGKGIACQTTMSHDDQRPMTLHAGQLQLIASNTPQEYEISDMQWELQRLRCENNEMRNALKQYRNEDSSSEGPESQPSDASPKEVQARNTDPNVKDQDADVEMVGSTAGQHSTAQQSIEVPVVLATPPATSESGERLRFSLQRSLSSINRDPISSTGDAQRRRDSRRHERRRRRRDQRRLEREEEARQQQRGRSRSEEEDRRWQQRSLRREGETQGTRKHHRQCSRGYKQKKKTRSRLAWVIYLNRRRTWRDALPLSYMFPAA